MILTKNKKKQKRLEGKSQKKLLELEKSLEK